MLDYKEFQDIDLKLHLQSGSAIKLGNLVIKPYTLKEIKSVGYKNYMQNLQLLSISIDDFVSSVVEADKRAILENKLEHLKTYDFYVTLGGRELLDKLMKSLKMVFRTDDVRLIDDKMIGINFVKKGILVEDSEGNLVIDEDNLDALSEDEITLVHRDNFDDLVEIIKLQNYLERASAKESVKEEVYADEETKQLMEDMERHRKRVEAKKKAQALAEGKDDEIDLTDIISAVSSKSNSINRLTIWRYTLYQLYDEYSRLELIDNYNFSIKAMLAGAEKVDLKHWSSRL